MELSGPSKDVHRLVDEHYVALFRYAFRLSGSVADAEDLTQEAFCKAQLNLKQLRDKDRAKPWLFSILRNCYLHRLRAERHQPCVSLNDIDVPDEPPKEMPEFDTDQLQEALNALPETFRTPLILYFFEDFSYRDIAEQMDLPLGTVMSRLARAKGYLRIRLTTPPTASVNGSHKGRATDGL